MFMTWAPGAFAGPKGARQLTKAHGGVDDAALPWAGDQIRKRDLIGSNVQASGRVHSINPEVFDGIAGVHYLCPAIQYILIGAGSLARQRKVHASATEAIDYAQRCYFPQVHVAVRSPFHCG